MLRVNKLKIINYVVAQSTALYNYAPKMWKKLLINLRESQCKSGEIVSTFSAAADKLSKFVKKSKVFSIVLHVICRWFYTPQFGHFNLFGRRIYTVST